jgi:hypothetical protein
MRPRDGSAVTRLRLWLRDGLRVSPLQSGLLGRLVEQSVAASSDDANEVVGGGSDGVVSTTGPTIGFQSDRFAGFRFTPTVPQFARVLRAHIQFTSSAMIAGSGTAPCTLKIWYQTAGSAATFTTASKSITSRPGTSHSVDWKLPLSASVSDWLTGDRGLNQRTPDLRHLVREVIDGAGWASDHGLVSLLHHSDGRPGSRQVFRSRSCDPGAGEADPQVRYPMIRPDSAQLGRPRPSATRPRSGSLARRRLPGRAARLRTGDIRSVMTEGLIALVHRLAPVGTLKS